MSTDTLQPFAEHVWTIDGDRIRMYGIPFSTRMTVIRLSTGALWLHSPVQPTRERIGAVESLGLVGHIVAPNKLHNLFVGSWAEHITSATTWADKELQQRRSDLRFDQTLAPEPPSAWRDDIDQIFFGGSRVLPETVFLHRQSGTVIVTDILQNHEPSDESWFWRRVKALNGILAPHGGAPRDWRLTVRDRDAARRARDQILAWDFDRLIMTHGRCLKSNARVFVERGFAWLD